MNSLDWLVVALYVIGLIALSVYLSISTPVEYRRRYRQTKKEPGTINWKPRYVLLIIYFLGIMFLSYLVGAMWI